jgi:putative DNA primase/helicase
MIVYDIRNRAGETVAFHTRRDLPDGKRMAWRQPDGTPSLNGTSTASLPLYGAHLLDTWPQSTPVVICEGEKSADALVALGIPAVATVTGAAVTPNAAVLADLSARTCLLWADNDPPGRQHMERIAEVLEDIAVVGWVDWPEAPEKGDAADYVAAGHRVDEVRALLATAHALPAAMASVPTQSIASAEVP